MYRRSSAFICGFYCLLSRRVCASVAVALASVVVAPVGAESPDPGCRITVGGEDAAVRKVRLAGATRDALALGAGGEAIAVCDGSAGVFVVSTGARGVPASAAVAFYVDVEGAQGWVPLWRGGGAAGVWADHRIELLATGAAAERRLRLRAVPSAAAAGMEFFWGSPRFLPARPSGSQPMNVILISLDTLGAAYLGTYGGHAKASPNIDAFLGRSFAFHRAYATYPNTLVSHASLLSGLYPSSHGVYGSLRNSRVGVDLLSTVLRERGYFNVAFTENAFVSSDFGFDEDFDWYDDGPDRGEASFLGDARETFGRARQWLERFGADAPFLLFVHTYEVHSPYIARDEESRRIADGVFAGPEVPSHAAATADVEHLHNAGFERLSPDQIRRLEALHVGEIHYLDRQFAELMASIERMPFAERTLVVVFADHGDEFDPHGKIGHGETLHDIVMHVPLAFYLPAGAGSAVRVLPGGYDRPVSLVDVAPTVLDLLGIAGALPGDGRSLRPLLAGEASELPPRAVFTELLKAAGVCAEAGLPEDCFVGRFGVYTDEARFEYSSVPRYEKLTKPADAASAGPAEGESEAFHALLSAYVTGSPWQSRAPWQPRAVDVQSAPRQDIDDATRERLEALGYDF